MVRASRCLAGHLRNLFLGLGGKTSSTYLGELLKTCDNGAKKVNGFLCGHSLPLRR